MLLDIAMPGMDGIEVARALANRRPSPAVVFVTAFDQFAVAAFEVAAVDYLMKPIEPARLQKALDRARVHLRHRGEEEALSAAPSAYPGGILGVRPVGPGPHRHPRCRPGVGRARLYAAARRRAQLADPSFDGGAGGQAGSAIVRAAASLGDRSPGFHYRLFAQPLGALDRQAGRRQRTAGRPALCRPRKVDRRAVAVTAAAPAIWFGFGYGSCAPPPQALRRRSAILASATWVTVGTVSSAEVRTAAIRTIAFISFSLFPCCGTRDP